MAEPKIDIHYVAHLARLDLSDKEEALLREQLGAVLGYVRKLEELELEGVEAMAHAVPLVNVSRPDAVQSSLAQSQALRNAPAHADGLFLVPKIVE
jgi:aspartyl-tRNA(Asn)/glutamyl-tRNA(Gln) amidotransferase subunit C